MLKCLDFRDADLTNSIPDQAGKEGWESVDLSCNQLQQIRPGSIATTLVELNLSYNKFSDFPSVLASLTLLTKLQLASNALKVLGTCLAELTSLKHLELAGNKLKDVSVVVASLTALEHLDLSQNLLREAPVSAQSLKHLSSLDLSFNRITYVHKHIGQLSRLACLKVHPSCCKQDCIGNVLLPITWHLWQQTAHAGSK